MADAVHRRPCPSIIELCGLVRLVQSTSSPQYGEALNFCGGLTGVFGSRTGTVTAEAVLRTGSITYSSSELSSGAT